jgi:hypothetical protein
MGGRNTLGDGFEDPVRGEGWEVEAREARLRAAEERAAKVSSLSRLSQLVNYVVVGEGLYERVRTFRMREASWKAVLGEANPFDPHPLLFLLARELTAPDCILSLELSTRDLDLESQSWPAYGEAQGAEPGYRPEPCEAFVARSRSALCKHALRPTSLCILSG